MSENFDMLAYNDRAEKLNVILDKMASGEITAYNISEEQVKDVVDAMAHQIMMREVSDEFGNRLFDVKPVKLRQGVDYVFATNLDGLLGLYALDGYIDWNMIMKMHFYFAGTRFDADTPGEFRTWILDQINPDPEEEEEK